MDSVFRSEHTQVGTPAERRKILREIIAAERRELGIAPVPRDVLQARRKTQEAHIARIARPTSVPDKRHTNFLRAPRSLRGKGLRSPDGLFATGEDDEETGEFWLYESQKVTQSTMGSMANKVNLSPAEIHASPVCQVVKKKLDALVAQAEKRKRCGIIFDIVSTSKIINSGIPHEIGNFIYDYVETVHFDKTSIKFTFVGITDNVNCCAARDVFCRDELLKGKYIGDTKRTFDALDNVHMFTVFPGRTSLRQQTPASRPGSGSMGELPPVRAKTPSALNISGGLNASRPPAAKQKKAASPPAVDGFDGTSSAFLTEIRASSSMS